MSIEQHLSNSGIVLPVPAVPVASYVSVVIQGGLAHVSGQIPFDADGALMLGRMGAGPDLAFGQQAAERCGLMVLAQLKAALGSLDRVEQIVKLGVFIASTPEFTDQPKVANGASDLMVRVFGDAGKHARSAVGVAVLPLGVVVEIDAVVAIRD
jgi:enamine deaminase RidA (YjgF/YER057c/UK114 family)